MPAYCRRRTRRTGWLPDTLLTRSIIIRMRRRHGDEQFNLTAVALSPRKASASGRRSRSGRERCRRRSGGRTCPTRLPTEPPTVWESLLAVADLVGGDWPKRAREAAVALVKSSREVESSLGIRLLADLRTIFGDSDAMASKVILHRLCALEEAPWGDLKGKPLSERALASRLKQYGVKSKTVRIGDATPRGYTAADLDDAWRRYLPHSSSAESATSATSATSTEKPTENVSDVADGASNVADDVADVADGVADGGLKNPQ